MRSKRGGAGIGLSSVVHDITLTGDGTPISPLGVAIGAGVNSITGNIVDNTDPLNPIVTSASVVWNGTDAFSVFYADKGIATIAYPVTVALEGTGHTIDAGVYDNLDTVWFDSDKNAKKIVVNNGAELLQLPHLLRKVILVNFNTTNYMSTSPANPSGQWYIGNGCGFINGVGASAAKGIDLSGGTSLLVYCDNAALIYKGGGALQTFELGNAGVLSFNIRGPLSTQPIIIWGIPGSALEIYYHCDAITVSIDPTVYTNFTGTFYTYQLDQADKMAYDNSISGLIASNVQDAIDEIAINVSEIPPYKIYTALLSQNTPVVSQTSGAFMIGQIWTITTYVAGDDFSNMEYLSGGSGPTPINSSGAIFKAIATIPLVWTNSSDLASDGSPYLTSLDISGSLVPFENTIGDIIWSYSAPGIYFATLAGAFPLGKVFPRIVEGTVSIDALDRISDNQLLLTTSIGNDVLLNRPVEIRIYPPSLFSFQIKILNPSEIFRLPTDGSGTYNFKVYWGDGNSDIITNWNQPEVNHVYADAGDYVISMDGSCDIFSFAFQNMVTNAEKVTRVINFVDLGFSNLSFGWCHNLTTIANNMNVIGTYITGVGADDIFYECYSLQAIPPGSFDGMINANTFNATFYRCAALTSIPVNLFDNCVSATEFNNTFTQCINITSIPVDLFKFNTAVTSFYATFSGTYITDIPANLFDTNILVTTFAGVFGLCIYLTAIPVDLFKFNTKVESFGAAFYGDIALTTIPALLFAYNYPTTIMGQMNFEYAFQGCENAQYVSNMFCDEGTEMGTRFLGKIVNWQSCFSRNAFSGVQGIAPELWNYAGTMQNTSGCFGGAGNSITSLSNYASIDAGWL